MILFVKAYKMKSKRSSYSRKRLNTRAKKLNFYICTDFCFDKSSLWLRVKIKKEI